MTVISDLNSGKKDLISKKQGFYLLDKIAIFCGKKRPIDTFFAYKSPDEPHIYAPSSGLYPTV